MYGDVKNFIFQRFRLHKFFVQIVIFIIINYENQF